MTREEAIKSIEDIRQKFLRQYGEETVISIPIDGDDMQAFDMAIKALEQEFCEDAVNRKDVINILPRFRFRDMNTYLEARNELDKLPSVLPKQPKCEDVVSREAVLAKKVYTETEEGWSGYTVDVKEIENLPSVYPKKTEREDTISRKEVNAIIYDAMFDYMERDVAYRALTEIRNKLNDLPSIRSSGVDKKSSETESVRRELLERGDEMVSFRQLVERFDEIEETYKGEPWNLEQIYSNFNILMGKEFCEDAISRQAMIDAFWKLNVELRPNAIDAILNMVNDLPSVAPKQKTGWWIKYGIPRCEEQHYQCTNCDYYINFGKWGELYTKEFKYCPNCGARMEV